MMTEFGKKKIMFQHKVRFKWSLSWSFMKISIACWLQMLQTIIIRKTRLTKLTITAKLEISGQGLLKPAITLKVLGLQGIWISCSTLPNATQNDSEKEEEKIIKNFGHLVFINYTDVFFSEWFSEGDISRYIRRYNLIWSYNRGIIETTPYHNSLMQWYCRVTQ